MIVNHIGQYVGNYRLVRLLGTGGQASVYLGEHRYLKRSAAIKILRTSLNELDVEGFLTEAQLLASLSHPHIVRVLEYSVEQGIPFLTMEYAPGGSLRSLYPANSCLQATVVIAALKQIAAALQYAHDHHIIHRDIKPENFLLNAQQEIMLSDFGIALLAPSPELLSTQGMVGTLPYMAPEQLRGKPCFASDQYALGIIAYEWLCGSRPFQGSLVDIMAQHLSSPPPRLCEKLPSLPQSLEQVILKAMAKNPEQRYENVTAFVQALEDASQQKQGNPKDASYAPEIFSFPTSPVVSLSVRSNAKIISAPSSPEETIPTSVQRGSKQDMTNFSGTTNSQRMHTNVRLARQDRQNREYMLKQMRSVWIEGVFENSLYQAILIELGLSATPQAVTNPWKLEVQETDLPAHPLPSGTRITTAYDSADGKLLILGEPGAGKTTLLLELARDLIKRAEADEQVRIPVVFPLASWAMKRESLSTWLIEELQTKYYLPHHLAQKWIKNGQIIPLLDGLDEVALEYRRMCLDVINTYHKEHYLDPLVICSRRKEYDALKTPLVIRQAVMIQPLQREQIDAYFERIGEPVAALRQTIQKNTDLQELATTPLLLSILTLAYQGTTAYDLRDQRSVEALRGHIFERYVERMLTRRGKTTSYTNEQIRHWLTWLASHMKQQHLTTFYLERMQLDWLPGKWWRLVNRFVIGLLFGIGSGLPFGLFFGLAGEMAGGLPLGLLFGLLFGLLGGLRKIRPAETIHWSWNTLKRRLYVVALFGLPGGLLCGVSNAVFGNLLSGLLFGLFGGLLFGLLGALFAGISQGTMNAQFLLTPNYGMQRSVKNSLYVGILSLVATELVAVLFVVLISGLGSIVMDEILIWLFNALFVGLFIGLFVGLLYGGTAPFQQKLLLLSLYRLGSLPKNTIAFLEYANERILLRRVGGGYMFAHQLLLDYFASQEQPHTPEQK